MHNFRKSAGRAAAALAAMAMLTGAPSAQALYVYPAQGQSAEQTQKDQYECHTWAVGQTGYDPTNPSSNVTAPAQAGNDGTVLRGALRGAAVGGVVGAITDNSVGNSMAAGAAAGGLLGTFRRVDQSRAVADQQQAAAQTNAARLGDYNKALTACLQGRGYTVS